jgi:hypothetical protein
MTKFQETKTVELKKSTSELKEAVRLQLICGIVAKPSMAQIEFK